MSESRSDNELQAACMQAALRLLALREHSCSELRIKLTQREFGPVQIAAVLDLCQREGWQSDERYASSMVRYRSAKGDGPEKIRHFLHHKGVEASIAEQALSDEPVDWFALAKKIRMQKYPEIPKNWKGRQKCQRYLFLRGFDSGMIRYAMDE